MVPRRLCAVVAVLLAVAACSDDSKPTTDGKPPVVDHSVTPREATTSADHGPACKEGNKICATLHKVQTCQGGKWVDTADCTQMKDPSGGSNCTCSATLMFVCQYNLKECK